MHIPERYAIKNSKFGFSDLFYIGIFLLSAYFTFQTDSNVIGLSTAIIGLIVFGIVRRLKDDSEQIVIDENGITLNCNNAGLIKWKNIKFAYIKQTVRGTGKSTRVINWFHIETKSEEFTVEMSDFSYDSSLLAETVNHFSKRKIGHISNKLNHGVSHLLKNKDLADEVYLVFNAYFKRQYGFVWIWLLLLAVAGILQAIIGFDFPYVFAVGWCVALLASLIYSAYETKKLYSHESLVNLGKETIEKLMNEYGKKFGHATTKTSIAGYVFLGLFTVFIFGLSYFWSISR